jgi:NAD(P)-dependent dehydrogenase (short-subunit alcohol dehydrogenase family)
MRVFVTGATGALGRHLVPGLVAAGHEVTATTRTPAKVARLRQAGAEPVVVDGLDREAVIAAVRAAAPEGIVLRYGTFYGPGASDVLVEAVRRGRNTGRCCSPSPTG